MASFSSACQCIFTLVLLVIASSPLKTHARESRFFSKVSRTEPETLNPKPNTLNPKPETQTLSPSLFTKATTEKGYGLFGKEENYEYPPTTTNPTKSEPVKFNNNGYRYGAGEKQGMSDTRFFENGKYFYDVQNNGRLTENNEGHETFYGSESGSQYKGERYGTGEKQGKVYGTGERQGMSDTRFMENGKYFYDLEEAEKEKKENSNNNNNNGYSNNAELYNNNKYEEEEGEEEENGNELYETEGSVKYNEAPSDVEFYDNGKTNEYSEKVRYNQGGSYGKESEKYNGYKFKTTPNKFPKYEFDSMEEYDKYEEGRSHQKEYAP